MWGTWPSMGSLGRQVVDTAFFSPAQHFLTHPTLQKKQVFFAVLTAPLSQVRPLWRRVGSWQCGSSHKSRRGGSLVFVILRTFWRVLHRQSINPVVLIAVLCLYTVLCCSAQCFAFACFEIVSYRLARAIHRLVALL